MHAYPARQTSRTAKKKPISARQGVLRERISGACYRRSKFSPDFIQTRDSQAQTSRKQGEAGGQGRWAAPVDVHLVGTLFGAVAIQLRGQVALCAPAAGSMRLCYRPHQHQETSGVSSGGSRRIASLTAALRPDQENKHTCNCRWTEVLLRAAWSPVPGAHGDWLFFEAWPMCPGPNRSSQARAPRARRAPPRGPAPHGLRDGRAARDLGQADVRDLGGQARAVQQHVGALNVEVDDFVRVQVRQPGGHAVREQPAPPEPAEAPRRAVHAVRRQLGPERAAGRVLHHHHLLRARAAGLRVRARVGRGGREGGAPPAPRLCAEGQSGLRRRSAPASQLATKRLSARGLPHELVAVMRCARGVARRCTDSRGQPRSACMRRVPRRGGCAPARPARGWRPGT